MRKSYILMCVLSLWACAAKEPPHVIPSLEYTKQIRKEMAAAGAPMLTPALGFPSDAAKARLNFVSNEGGTVEPNSQLGADATVGDLAPADSSQNPQQPGFYEYRSSAPVTRDYKGPLNLGDPGVAASLWRESRNGTELFRDDRAWQPMDLITILVSETSEGSKEANTEVKEKSTIKAAIENVLGFEADAKSRNKNLDTSSLVSASMQNDFKGEGQTDRKDSLKAKISAMVAEVLPSGILRVEGERIISVNSEEQVMVISGLVRPRDINSNNEVDSAKMANLRVDYYGRGIVGEAQNGGWMGRIIRTIWPF